MYCIAAVTYCDAWVVYTHCVPLCVSVGVARGSPTFRGCSYFLAHSGLWNVCTALPYCVGVGSLEREELFKFVLYLKNPWPWCTSAHRSSGVLARTKSREARSARAPTSERYGISRRERARNPEGKGLARAARGEGDNQGRTDCTVVASQLTYKYKAY